LLGSFTPSMANISRPSKPCRSQIASTAPEHPGDVLAHAADEVGDGGEMRAAIAAQGDEGHLFPASPLDATAADNALRIGEQHHLQQHRRRIRRGPRLVVAKPRIEARQIDLVIE